ncbi:hypothetical protein BFG60_3038 [Microcystis aeruginosa NIES-98]|nr:hypothetical protein BFG60_3038 [Microcystis aeruginosa NIES-98]
MERELMVGGEGQKQFQSLIGFKINWNGYRSPHRSRLIGFNP